MGRCNRETESFRITAQDNAIKTSHVKTNIGKTQQDIKCRLCGDWDETIYHMINECSKLAQKEDKDLTRPRGEKDHLRIVPEN